MRRIPAHPGFARRVSARSSLDSHGVHAAKPRRRAAETTETQSVTIVPTSPRLFDGESHHIPGGCPASEHGQMACLRASIAPSAPTSSTARLTDGRLWSSPIPTPPPSGLLIASSPGSIAEAEELYVPHRVDCTGGASVRARDG